MKITTIGSLFSVIMLSVIAMLSSCSEAVPPERNVATATGSVGASCVEKAGQKVCSQNTYVSDSEHVVVYYFHGDRRCRTCRGIQATIEQTINENFADQIVAGRLEYREVNFEDDENKHFIQQFQLSFGTMIVATVKGDKILEWENCGKVWDYGHESTALVEYVADRVREHLGKLGGK